MVIRANVKDNEVSFLAQQRKKSSSYMKNDQDPKIQEIESLISNNLPKNKDTGEFWYADDHLIDLGSFILASEEPEKFCSDLEPHWIKVEKSVPWWRAADKDELASLVSCKSFEHVMNSDLPQPQTENLGGKGSIHLQWFEHNKAVDSSSDQMVDKQVPHRANNAQGSPSLGSLDGQHGRQCSPGDAGRPPLGLDRPFGSTTLSSIGSNTTSMDEVETPQRAVVDLSKAQLLEALCHSQTRAREAEKAAQKAYDEKEHITMLFLRQASFLFAYRQWFQILQLENLCLQLKSKDQATSIHFPVFLPWITSKNRKMRKGKHKVTKRKLPPPGKKIRKRLVAFAVGLSCAGAGLLLGWTMGFLFLAF
ncbi:uncharacterized protein LOC127797302 [Diospyros lotus]|uniref:uncharacterized protein LOC127797302 n=1 Tax=Diospyros lotus TaxID=55363 RepID=UPI002254CD51|nr:uncharacterized protein LOC127797302 [Diospyros lotus]XP_052186055.1 uncharacterized protein LOC127797302 [Diospyros lotus]